MTAEQRTLTLRLEPRRIIRVLAVLAGLLVVAGVLGEVSRIVFERGRLGGLIPMFNLDAEANVPAFFSALLLLTCAVVLAVLAHGRGRAGLPYARALWGLAAITAFLAVDEAAAIHELFTNPMRSGLGAGGLFHFAWVVVYGMAALLIFALYAPLLPRVPRRTRRLLLAAVVLYAGGALGLEIAAGAHLDLLDGGTEDAWYAMLSTVEEATEMAAVLVLLYALLVVLRAQSPRIRIDLGTAPTLTPTPGEPAATRAR